MRQAFAGSMVACLLLMPTVTMAQDEDLRMGDDPAYFERVEVPEVGIALAFPPAWDVEIEMDYQENQPGDPETGYWTVLYAEGGGATWCDMTMNASRMGDLVGLAARTAENFAASRGEAASAQANSVRLAVGDGYRVDVQDPDEGTFTTIYIFDSETARYSMVCMTEERDERDWMDIAETIEWLPQDGIIEPPGTEPVDEPEPEPVDEPEPVPVDTPSSDDQRIEVPAAGISLTIPEGWTYETVAESGDYQLPSEFGEGSTVPLTRVISMDPGAYVIGTCGITTFGTMPMSLERHAHELGSRLSGSDPSTLPVTTLIELPIGAAARVDFEFVATGYPSAGWAFDVGGLRVVVDCWADRDEKSVWGAMVESIEPLGAEPVGDGQRIEIPGTDIAITFPVDWVVESTFEEDFFELPPEYGDDATAINWEVLLALSPEASLCFVEMYDDMPLGLVEHGDLLARRLDQRDTGTVESGPAALPVGESVRVTLSDPGEELFMEAYLFDAGGVRYEFSCLDEVHSDAWLDLAETIESLAPHDQGTDSEHQVPSGVLPYELERVDVPEAGLSLLLPPDWDVEIPMKELGYGLPPEYEDIGVIEAVKVLEADSGMGEMCSLNRHADNPMPLQEHAMWDVQGYRELAADDPVTHVERTAWVVAGEAAERIDFTRTDGPERMSVFLFDSGGVRYGLLCHSDVAENPAWQQIADSVQPLGGEPVIEPEPDVEDQRDDGTDPDLIELPDAGVAISLSPAWEVDTLQEQLRATLPPEYGESATVPLTQFLVAFEHDEGWWCAVYRFDETPLSIDEQAAWSESLAASDPDDPVTVDITPVTLPIGDAVRVFKDYEYAADNANYLFDLDGYRFNVSCGGEVVPDDTWLSVVETVEPLGGEPTDERPQGVPAEATAWWEVGPFESTIPVDETRVMRASCQQALWIEFPDETFAERVECTLSDDPVDPSESQGEVPAETITVEGGACEWVSDFWVATDGSEVWADSWSMVIEPDGSVTGSSVYGSELLECPE